MFSLVLPCQTWNWWYVQLPRSYCSVISCLFLSKLGFSYFRFPAVSSNINFFFVKFYQLSMHFEVILPTCSCMWDWLTIQFSSNHDIVCVLCTIAAPSVGLSFLSDDVDQITGTWFGYYVCLIPCCPSGTVKYGLESPLPLLITLWLSLPL